MSDLATLRNLARCVLHALRKQTLPPPGESIDTWCREKDTGSEYAYRFTERELSFHAWKPTTFYRATPAERARYEYLKPVIADIRVLMHPQPDTVIVRTSLGEVSLYRGGGANVNGDAYRIYHSTADGLRRFLHAIGTFKSVNTTEEYLRDAVFYDNVTDLLAKAGRSSESNGVRVLSVVLCSFPTIGEVTLQHDNVNPHQYYLGLFTPRGVRRTVRLDDKINGTVKEQVSFLVSAKLNALQDRVADKTTEMDSSILSALKACMVMCE